MVFDHKVQYQMNFVEQTKNRYLTSTLGFSRIASPLHPFGANTVPTDPNASPDYDTWGWDSWWTYQNWMTWFESMEKRYGVDIARRNWEQAWQKQEPFSGPLDARLNSDFRQWAALKNIELYWGAGVIAKPVGAAVDAVTGVSSGISALGSVSKIMLPLAGILLAYLYFQSITPKRR